jgi:osmotically-inducible protein OsmY
MFVRITLLGCLALGACHSAAAVQVARNEPVDPGAARAEAKESGAKPVSDDPELAEAVRERLANHPAVTLDGMQISAAGAAVTLRGRADSEFEKKQAELASRRVRGVKRVISELVIVPLPPPGRDDEALEAELSAAFASDPRIDPGLVGVHVEEDVVTLTGTLPDWDMIDAVLQHTFAVQPRAVVNRLERAYRPQRHSEL